MKMKEWEKAEEEADEYMWRSGERHKAQRLGMIIFFGFIVLSSAGTTVALFKLLT